MNRNHRPIDQDEARLLVGLVLVTFFALNIVAMSHVGCIGCGGLELSDDVTPEQRAVLEERMVSVVEKMLYATVGLIVLSIVGQLAWDHRDWILSRVG